MVLIRSYTVLRTSHNTKSNINKYTQHTKHSSLSCPFSWSCLSYVCSILSVVFHLVEECCGVHGEGAPIGPPLNHLHHL